MGEQAAGQPDTLEDVRTELHDKFNKQGYSDYIVVYLRLITSGQLQTQHEFYQNFIEGPRTVTEFCRQVCDYFIYNCIILNNVLKKYFLLTSSIGCFLLIFKVTI